MLRRPPGAAPNGTAPPHAAVGRYEIVASDDDSGERIDRVLAARVPGLSRSRVKALIEAGALSAGGRTIDEPSTRVKPGQTFAIVVPDPVEARLEAQALALDIVYEDSDIIVIDKPAGMVVHPAPGNPDRTLVNALIAHCGPELAGIGGVLRPGIVHRLDKGTSGLMVAAKCDAAHRGLVQQFAERRIERSYLAFLWGQPHPPQGEIAGNIGRSPRNRKKMAVLRRGGKTAVTRYRVLRPLAEGAVALVECRLLTGRTHQIRVHMAEQGHPLLGDPLYGRGGRGMSRALGAAARRAIEDLGRQALHAQTLGFQHPTTLAPLRFSSRLPQDLKSLKFCLE